VRWCRECASRLANLQWPHLGLATAYAQSGQLEEARAEAEEVLRINPVSDCRAISRRASCSTLVARIVVRVGRCAMAGFQQEA
jgi:Tfp pilus assembly protein PilF